MPQECNVLGVLKKKNDMKKIYSTVMMLAMMVAALSFTACSSDDDNGGGGGSSKKTLIIDGQSYYYGNGCTVEQSDYYGGMYLTVEAVEDINWPVKGKELVFRIPPSKVSELSVGQVFTYDDITIRTFRGLSEMAVDSYNWDALSGEVVIKDIKATELTIQINNLTIKSNRGAVREIEGTATLRNCMYDSNGNIMPFSET